MKRSVFVLVGLLFTTGCSGVIQLGEYERIDKTILEIIQITTKGESGPKIKVVETHVFDPATGKSKKIPASVTLSGRIVGEKGE